MTDHSNDLLAVIALSQALLEKAGEQAWDEVAVLHGRRNELLQRVFADPVEPDHAVAVSDAIRAIMVIDQDVMALLAQAKSAASEVLQQLEKGKRAVSAYTA